MSTPINNAFHPFPRIETRRLVLRSLTVEDAPAVFAIFSDPEVTRYYDVPTMIRLEQARALIVWWSNRIKNRKALRWAITFQGAEDQLVGTCGFSELDKPNHLAEIGIDIMRLYWGKGIATEATRAMINFGFRVMQLNRIETWVSVENIGSLKVIRKAGFQTEGILRARRFWQGSYQDVEMFGLLKNDFLTHETDG
jgi:[ribosomal protein S5]-alanine N-acetyltransferase